MTTSIGANLTARDVSGNLRVPNTRCRRFNDIVAPILVLAALLRVATLIIPHSFFADEVFQYFEPAHRLLFGDGVITWEYRYGIRSWTFPLFLAIPMKFGAALAPASNAYLLLPKVALLTISTIGVAAATAMGRRISALHGTFAALVTAIWFEQVFFATQALTEAIAVPIFLCGAALTTRKDPKTHITGGFLLGMAAVLRFQYGPAIAVFILLTSAGDRKHFIGVTVGSTIALIVSCATDIGMGDVPFRWLLENFHQNIGLQRSHLWVDGPFFYPLAITETWGWWTVPITSLCLFGARRCPALFVTAAVNVAVHSLIAHKEYRYILLSTAIVILLAAIGTAEALIALHRRIPETNPRRLAVAAAVAWMMASASIAASGMVRWWWTHDTATLRTFEYLRDEPHLCGVALFGIGWAGSGGYSYLHRPVPLFAYGRLDGVTLAREARQFDAIVVAPATPVPAGFMRDRCFVDPVTGEAACVATRPGGCAPQSSAFEINRLLARIDR